MQAVQPVEQSTLSGRAEGLKLTALTGQRRLLLAVRVNLPVQPLPSPQPLYSHTVTVHALYWPPAHLHVTFTMALTLSCCEAATACDAVS